MSELNVMTLGDGTRIAYRLDGDAGKPVLLLSNSIATTLHMWDGQIEALSTHFRVLRYDFRGHGGSSTPAGAYSLDRLGRDVIELLDGLGIEHVHFLGLSLGGFVGQWLGVREPERIDRLILANTSSHLGPASYIDQRITATLQAPDMTNNAEEFLANWFRPPWSRPMARSSRGFAPCCWSSTGKAWPACSQQCAIATFAAA